MIIKIFTEVGDKIGYGHIMRCNSLYEVAFQYNIDVELIVSSQNGRIKSLERKKVKYKYWYDIDFLSANINNSDYVIVDSYIAKKDHYEVIAKKAKRAIYIDDTGRVKYPEGIIVNPAFEYGRYKYSYMNSQDVLSGLEYIILRSEFRVTNEKPCGEKIKNILILLGGTDICNLTLTIISEICLKNKNINYHIIVQSKRLDEFRNQYNLSNIFFYTELTGSEVCQLMQLSDFAITTAGTTTYELIATNTPFLAIQVAENQRYNCSALSERVDCNIVFKYDKNSFMDTLTEKIFIINDYCFRLRLKKKMKNLVDGKGAERIIMKLVSENESQYIYLREVQEEDLLKIFNLSNKDYVREYSLNTEMIRWEDHLKWFTNTINDEKIVFYVVTNIKKEFLGQIRFNIIGNSAIVSISLEENLKGKNRSRDIFNNGINKFLYERNEVDEIIAYISEKNLACITIIKKLGFASLEQEGEIKKYVFKREQYKKE